MMWIGRLWRWFFAVVFLTVAWKLASGVYSGGGSNLSILGIFLLALAATLLSCFCVLPELLSVASSPFRGFIDSIYLPGGHEKKRPLEYDTAERYERRRQYRSAAAEYASLVHDYPFERRAHIGLLRLLGGVLRRPWAARFAYLRTYYIFLPSDAGQIVASAKKNGRMRRGRERSKGVDGGMAEVICPSCFESFEVPAPHASEVPADFDYDCEICCRPMMIAFTAEGDEVFASARGLGE